MSHFNFGDFWCKNSNVFNLKMDVGHFRMKSSIFHDICGKLSSKDFVENSMEYRIPLQCRWILEKYIFHKRSLCEGLLQKSPSNRLGCSRGRHGVMEVKIHPWFNSINWRRMEAGRAKPSFEPDPHAVYAKVSVKNTSQYYYFVSF